MNNITDKQKCIAEQAVYGDLRVINIACLDLNPTFIVSLGNESIDNQIYEFEDWLGKEHPSGISCIYKSEIIEKRGYYE